MSNSVLQLERDRLTIKLDLPNAAAERNYNNMGVAKAALERAYFIQLVDLDERTKGGGNSTLISL